MIDETLDQLQEGIEKAHTALRRELAKLRTGRANPDILDGIRVDYYGSPTPIKQLGSIGIPEARMLSIKVFDRAQVRAVERAIMESNLGFNPQSDGDIIRIPMPMLTEERRRDLVKIAKKYGEDCRIAIRKARHEAIDMLDQLMKDGDASEDEVERAKKKLESLVQSGNGDVDSIVSKREKDILEI